MADYTSVSLNIRILLTANHVKIITIFYGFHAYPIKLGAAIIPDSNTLSPGKCLPVGLANSKYIYIYASMCVQGERIIYVRGDCSVSRAS